MEDLFLLQTEKPSVLGLHFDIIKEGRLDYAPNFCFTEFNRTRNFQHNPHHIYITNSEEIKLNDYITDGYIVLQWKDDSSLLGRKKVILTTDQDLIKDGVQAIEYEFLEWFFKNPSCEEVGIKVEFMQTPDYLKDGFYYKIVIPQEEPKQEIELIDGFIPTSFFDKQETLEEALKNELEFVHNSCRNFDFDLGFKTGGLIGANWQSKQLLSLDKEGLIKTDNDKLLYQIGVAKGMVQGIESQQKKSYSQEEAGELVYNFIGEYAKHYGVMIDGAKLNELFEQFKKK
jgi:hypothetical protein